MAAGGLAVVIQRRAATAGTGAVDALANHSSAAEVCTATIHLLVGVSAARVVLAVDDRVAAAVRVRSVDPFHDRLVAAAVTAVVVHLQ